MLHQTIVRTYKSNILKNVEHTVTPCCILLQFRDDICIRTYNASSGIIEKEDQGQLSSQAPTNRTSFREQRRTENGRVSS